MFFNNKGLSLILAILMASGTEFSYIPSVYAADNQPSSEQENQLSNTLTKLEIEGIALDQDFSADQNAYTATVNNEIESIQLQVEATNTNSTITINGQKVNGGMIGPFSLKTGENTFLITVDDGTNSVNTYTLTITRKKNENNLLNTITLSKGVLSPEFKSSVSDYNVSVANDAGSIIVTPQAAEKTSTVTVNNSLLVDKGILVQLPVGKSNITILVTAENGDKKTYTLHVTRAAKTVNNPTRSNTNKIPRSNNSSGSNIMTNRNNVTQQSNVNIQKTSTATLSSLTVSQGTWDSSFSKDEYTYHINLADDIKTVTINPTAAYSSAVITIEGAAAKTVELKGNKTVISVLVTRGEDRKTYVLVFDKKVSQPETSTTTAAVQPSSDTHAVIPVGEVNHSVSGSAHIKSKSSTSFLEKIVAFFKKLFS